MQEFTKVSRTVEAKGFRKLTIRLSLENSVKIYPGITELRHLIDPRRMVLLRERYAESKKKKTSAERLQSGLDEKWWADSTECCCYVRNVQG